MKINKTELSEVFQTEVINAGPLPCGFGLRVDLAHLKDLKGLLATVDEGYQYQNKGIYSLVKDAGLLVVGNAMLTINGKIELTRSVYQGALQQDFPHWDTPFAGSATVLFNKDDQTREAKTFYARMAAVRRALTQLNAEELGLDLEAMTAIAQMLDPRYTFSLRMPESNARNVLINKHPDITGHIIAQIPADEKYEHAWTTGTHEVIFHNNDPRNEIVHGRAASWDKANLIKGTLLCS